MIAARELALIGKVLAAARKPCPTAAAGFDADVNPWQYDELVHVLRRPPVEALLRRLLTPAEVFAWPWWLPWELGTGPQSYEAQRLRFVASVERARERIAPGTAKAASPPAPKERGSRKRTLAIEVAARWVKLRQFNHTKKELAKAVGCHEGSTRPDRPIGKVFATYEAAGMRAVAEPDVDDGRNVRLRGKVKRPAVE